MNQILKIGVISDSTIKPISDALARSLDRLGLDSEIRESPNEVVEQTILDSRSLLRQWQPDLYILYLTTPRIDLDNLTGATEHQIQNDIDEVSNQLIDYWKILHQDSSCKIIQTLYQDLSFSIGGLAESTLPWSQQNVIQRINQRLIEIRPDWVSLIDINKAIRRVGTENWIDRRLQYQFQFPFSPLVSNDVSKLFESGLRRSLNLNIKALVVDLDNTLWGGIVGDDGITGIELGPGSARGEAFLDFCKYIKNIARQGIVLSICSKNDIDVVAEVFTKHPHMPLKLDDFAEVVCNWKNKSLNIRRIAENLNLSLDSIAFIDDNPAECAEVHANIPEIRTVLMDMDPTSFIDVLDSELLFERNDLSDTDMMRTAYYSGRRKALQTASSTEKYTDFLEGLEMTCITTPLTQSNISRVAELESRTNQFNSMTRRRDLYSLTSLPPSTKTLTFQLKDRFLDHGIVGALSYEVSGDQLIITDWMMSCRVFARTLEQFCLQDVLEKNYSAIKYLKVEFLHTPKNNMMMEILKTLGFEDDALGYLVIQSSDVRALKTYIRTI